MHQLASFHAVTCIGFVSAGIFAWILLRSVRYATLSGLAAISGGAFLLQTLLPYLQRRLGWGAELGAWVIDISFNRLLFGGLRPDPIGVSAPAVVAGLATVALLSWALFATKGKLQRAVWVVIIFALVAPPILAREITLANTQLYLDTVAEGVRVRAEAEYRLFRPPYDLQPGRVDVEPIYSESEFVTSLAFGPSGEIFLGERAGAVRRARRVGETPQLLVEFNAETTGEGGLISMTVHPDYPDAPFLYVYYTEAGFTRNRLARLDLSTEEPVVEYILDDLPAARFHNGGGMAFGDGGALYVAIGESTHLSAGRDYEYPPGLQSIQDIRGKILRLGPDGRILPDNPVPGSSTFALGFRSPFRLRFDPMTKLLLVAENGPDVDDEINVVVALGNYGYPLVTGPASSTRYIDPLLTTAVPIGITGLEVYTSGVYGSAALGDLFFCGWNSGFLFHMPIERRRGGLRPAGRTRFYQLPQDGLCRLDLVQAPDGYFYMSDVRGVHRITRLDVGAADLSPVR